MELHAGDGLESVGAAEAAGHVLFEFIPFHHYLFVGAGLEVELGADALGECFWGIGVNNGSSFWRTCIDKRIGSTHDGNSAGLE